MLLPRVSKPGRVPLPPLDQQPLVSIIVPSFNQGCFIGDTIRSILDQDYRPLEIYVIDGASTDNTVEVLEGFADVPELDWISEPDKGVVEAVNKGFAKVTGQVIGIQSSDDMYLPGAVRTMVDALRQRPNHGLVYGDIETVDAGGTVTAKRVIRPYSIRDFLCKQTWIPQPSAFFRREMLDVCGGWDERYFNADTELWLRMAFRTNVEKIDNYIAQRRMHEDQRDNQKAVIVDAYRRMLQDSPDIKQASPDIRRAARAGVFLHAIRYNASGSTLRASLYLWRALLADPSLWENYNRSLLLVPGWAQFRGALSAVKQRLLRKSAHER
ncbi:Chondroitin synthase [Stieleria neptunia]|uniref:Chondroitin synthase n=1 Tax=Stieleria neptunia TaxID=2527979 RepID=A0A518HQR5_9BACT|nr:glycosyltransferase family 2 protein [Stieleria neptunia]QDV43147.1 Chondroitin synthase [Stieleria neptunia]